MSVIAQGIAATRQVGREVARYRIPGGQRVVYAHEVPGGQQFDPETVHESALASLSDEFAEIVDTAVALSRLQEVHARA